MNDYFGGDVFVTLELPNGEVHKFKAITANVHMDRPVIDCATYSNPFESFLGVPRIKFEFEANGEVITTQKEIKNRVEQYKKQEEWMCEYCGTPNEKKNKSCEKCGAPRSFIYEE